MNTHRPATLAVGSWLIRKLQQHQADRGTLHAAKLARKQGMPLALALAALLMPRRGQP